MSSETMGDSAEAERLSALVDGELDGVATDLACKRWKSDSDIRCKWHAYQLIGDVLRSDDLAAGPGHDQRFLLSLRARLELEPVVLAPASLVAPRVARVPMARAVAFGANRWLLPSAIAAGFLLVAGTFTVLRTGGLSPANVPSVALADATSSASTAVAPGSTSINRTAEPLAVVVNARLIRDARLDRYLAAHKQFSGSSALGLPSAFLRGATVESDAR